LSHTAESRDGIVRAHHVSIIDYRLTPWRQEKSMNRLRPRAYALFIAASLVVLAPAHLAAQAGTGTFSGTVVDDQGAAIPGANVTATELATGATRATASNAEGVFRLAGLPAGRYTVDVTLERRPIREVDDVHTMREAMSLQR
jgi:hypothetical protein